MAIDTDSSDHAPELAIANAGHGTAVTGQIPFDRARYDSIFSEGMVRVEGASLHYVKGGAGPALVLLHGWPQTSWTWHKIMPALAETHTVIAIDLPGLGSSTIPAGGFDAAHTARRLHEAVLALGYQQVQIMGHDIGAMMAYAYAQQFPADVSRMAVLEVALNGFGLEDAYGVSFHFGLNSSPEPIPESLIDDDSISAYLGFLFGSARRPEAIDQSAYLRAYATQDHRSAGYAYYRAFAENAQYNQASACQPITMPVLAIGAEFAFGASVAASFRAVASDVREILVPDCGHFIPEEDPAFLIGCVQQFFGDRQ